VISVERLWLLIIVNVNQPLPVARLREIYVESGGKGETFAPALSLLRSDKYVSPTDPIYCTAKGLATLQRNKFFKHRDAGRLFFLKTLSRSRTVGLDER